MGDGGAGQLDQHHPDPGEEGDDQGRAGREDGGQGDHQDALADAEAGRGEEGEEAGGVGGGVGGHDQRDVGRGEGVQAGHQGGEGQAGDRPVEGVAGDQQDHRAGRWGEVGGVEPGEAAAGQVEELAAEQGRQRGPGGDHQRAQEGRAAEAGPFGQQDGEPGQATATPTERTWVRAMTARVVRRATPSRRASSTAPT